MKLASSYRGGFPPLFVQEHERHCAFSSKRFWYLMKSVGNEVRWIAEVSLHPFEAPSSLSCCMLLHETNLLVELEDSVCHDVL